MSDITVDLPESVSENAIATAIKKKGGRPPRLGVAGRAKIKADREAEAVRESPRDAGQPRLRRKKTATTDKLAVPLGAIPPGVCYEWKRESVYGRKDTDNMNELMENHWRPVPEDRHQNFSTKKDGLILMERPDYLTQEAIQENYETSLNALARAKGEAKETPPGHFERDHPSVNRIAKITSTIERIPVPEK